MAKFWGIFFLAAWISGQIVRLPGEFPVTVLDAAVGIAAIGSLAGWKVVAVPRSGILLRKTAGSLRKFANFANSQKFSLWITIILILSWVIGLRLFSWQESIPGGLYLLRFLGYLWIIVNAERLLSPVKNFIIPAFWIFIILAWIQYLFLPDTRFLLQYGWDEHYYRMIGTVLDPNYLGVMLGVIGMYAIKKEEGEKIWRRSNFRLAALALSGLAVTYSRASWAAIIVVGCWWLVEGRGFRNGLSRGPRSRFAGGILGIIGLMGIWLVASKPGGEGVNLWRTNSIEQRITSWKEGIKVWRKHPWLGVGFNNYGVGSREYRVGGLEYGVINRVNHAENAPGSSWILLLATTGAVGAVGLVVNLSVEMIKKIKINKDVEKRGKRREGSLWAGILIMVGAHAVFNNTLFYPPVLGLLALIKAASED